jgi:hypothetical protein
MDAPEIGSHCRILGLAVLAVALASGVAACTDPGRVTEKVGLEKGLGLDRDEGWTVLKRPNSIWTVGTVIALLDNGSVRDLGTLESLACFPAGAWIVVPGTAPQLQYGREIDYGLSVSATLGLPKVELAKAGLSFGGDGEAPSHKSMVVLNKVTERRVDTLRAEEFLETDFAKMSPACQRNLLDAKRFVIDKILIIEDGELSFDEANGAKVDLSIPKYKVIQDAALKAGYSVTKDGSLKVQGTPVTFAVRQADFGQTLARLGYERRGPGEGNSLETVLVDAGVADPAGLKPFKVPPTQ